MASRGSISLNVVAGESRVVTEGAEGAQEPEIAADLVVRIRRGSREAEEAMVRRYGAPLLNILKRRTRDGELALDLRQDTFRIVLEKLRSSGLDEPERLAAYLRAVALNLLIAQRRKDTRRATKADSDAIEAVADEAGGPFDSVSREQSRNSVVALLRELGTARDREILKRLYLEEQDKETICAALGVDSAHFKRVLFRAKQRFRELLTRAERRAKLQGVG